MNWLLIAGILLDCACLALLVALVVNKCRNKGKKD